MTLKELLELMTSDSPVTIEHHSTPNLTARVKIECDNEEAVEDAIMYFEGCQVTGIQSDGYETTISL